MIRESGESRCHEQTWSRRALRGGDGSRYSRCRFRVLQKPILGTTDGQRWHCLGVRGFLLEILQAPMIAVEVNGQRARGPRAQNLREADIPWA